MAAKKKILASEVYVGNLSVEARLLAHDEQIKEALARIDANSAQFQEDMRVLRQESQDLLRALLLMAQRNEERFGKLEAAVAPAAGR